MTFDRRETPANDRVVAAWLAEQFPHLNPVEPILHHVAAPVLDLSLAPGGPRDRQLLYGAPFEVLEVRDDAAFGLSSAANYVGWVAAAGLRLEKRPDTVERISARQTHAYSEPDFKSPETCALSHMSIVSPTEKAERFVKTELGWVPRAHIGTHSSDPVETALLYIGTPYLWGGNSCWGIDCSGLVQAALLASGIDCPADSDLQCARLGQTVAPDTPPRRGDLLFWKGHVAMVVDGTTVLHANAYHMAVALEHLDQAIHRIAAQGDGDVLRHARLT